MISSSGPFTSTVSNLPIGSGVSRMSGLHRLTRPTSAPFRAGHHARIRPVMRNHPAEEPDRAVAGFPSPFGVSALASWVILRPLGSCASLTVGLPTIITPDPNGVVMLRMNKI